MNKMVINHIEKLFVTSDAATILREMEIVHPAAKMLVLAAQMQEQEVRVHRRLHLFAPAVTPRVCVDVGALMISSDLTASFGAYGGTKFTL